MSDPREFAAVPAVVPQKLSEFIRISALMGPQAFGRARDDKGGVCAFQGILDAAGLGLWQVGAIAATFPLLTQPGLNVCPVCGDPLDGIACVSGLIIHLNDAHRWTRNQIADLVETFEQVAIEVSR